jgi:replication-associated recombination protein RarA
MTTQAQMRHAASIARHIREQALEHALRECESIEYMYAHEQPASYANYSVSRLAKRFQDLYRGTDSEIGTILDDMLGGLTNE